MSSTTSVSLSQARELYNTIVACEAKLDSLEKKSKTTAVSFADLYNVVQDTFFILKRAGLPEDAVAIITMLQRMIITLNGIRVALQLMNTAMAGTPAGLVLAGLGLTMAFISMSDVAGSYG